MLDGRLPESITEDLSASEFEIGGTRFVISKLPAMPAFHLLESIRREVGRTTASEDPNASVGSLLQVILSLEPEFVDRVRRTLFDKVLFANEKAMTPQTLAGAEDTAFSTLEPVSVYTVLVRCLVVNFSASLRSVASILNVMGLTSSRSNPLD